MILSRRKLNIRFGIKSNHSCDDVIRAASVGTEIVVKHGPNKSQSRSLEWMGGDRVLRMFVEVQHSWRHCSRLPWWSLIIFVSKIIENSFVCLNKPVNCCLIIYMQSENCFVWMKRIKWKLSGDLIVFHNSLNFGR